MRSSVVLRRRGVMLAIAAAGLGYQITHAQLVNTTWNAGLTGSWGVAANWSGGVVPNNGVPAGTTYSVFVDGGQTGDANAILNSSFTISNLSISAGDRVTIPNAFSLAVVGDGVTGSVFNSGRIDVNAAGSNSTLFVNTGSIALSGGGTVALTGANSRLTGTGTLHNLNNTLIGLGAIGLNTLGIINAGTIAANGALAIGPTAGGMTNSGMLMSLAGGTVTLSGSSGGIVTNTGTIAAANASAVRLTNNASISGGTFTTSGTGSIRVSASNDGSFTDITNLGLMVGENNSDFNVSGTIANSGTISIEAGGSFTDIDLQTDTVLSGSGQVILSGVNAGVNTTAAGDPPRLTNGGGHTIRGQGRFGQNTIAITNNGLIVADVNNGTLTIDPANVPNAFVNNNILRATGGGILVLTGSLGGDFVNNGTISADDGSSVRLITNASVTGGTFTTSGSGSVRALGSQNVFFTNVTNLGLMVGENNCDFGISGTITNNGTISIEAAGSFTDVELQTDTVLAGTGQVILNGANAGIDGIGLPRLTNGGGHTIRGQGRFGQNTIAITSNGLVIADVSGGSLTIDPANVPNAFVNNNILRATGGGILVLTGSVGGDFVNNGTISADDGSSVRLITNASVTGGTFTTSGSGSVRALGSQNVFFTDIANLGLMVGENNCDFGVSGTITNNGTISIEAAGNFTDVELQTDTVLAGTGQIILSGVNAGIDGIGLSRLTNGGGHTIRGQGRLGQNTIAITNNGLIVADVSGGTLTIDPANVPNAFVNNGTLRASNGGTLLLTGSAGGTFGGTGGVEIQADSRVSATTSAIVSMGGVSGEGSALVSGSAVWEATHFRVGTLSTASATARVRASGGAPGSTSKVQNLVFGANGRVDLTDNELALDYTGGSPIANVRTNILSAFAGGAWTGTGLGSSSAAAAAPTNDKTGLGYVEATDLFTTFPANFGGVSVDDTTVLVRYTLLGDANLDRTVNIADFSRLGANFNTSGTWFGGDFNYDGMINIGDFSLLASNFNKTLAAGPGSRPGAVPEPTAVAVLAMAAGGLTRRRRR